MSVRFIFVFGSTLLFVGIVGCNTPSPRPFSEEMKRAKESDAPIGRAEAGTLGRAINEQNIWLAKRWVEIDEALEANDIVLAGKLIQQVAQVDPTNPRLKGAQISLRVKSEQPKQTPSQAPSVTVNSPSASSEIDIAVGKKLPVLEFRDAPLRAVMESLGRIGALNFIFDKDVRTDTRVSVSFRDATIKDALRAILVTQQLDFKALNRNSVIVFPNTPAKVRDYVDLQSRSFFLDNMDVKQAQVLIRSLVKTKDVFIDEKLNLLVMKDSPAAIRYAEQLLESVDQAEPEVMLDVQVLEVSTSRTREIGLKLPTSAQLSLPSTTPAGTALTRSNWGEQIVSLSSPSISASLRATLGDANLLSNPSIRVKNREKARIHIGEKLPVFTSIFNSTGVPGTTGNAFSTQVTLLEVGLKLDVEPLIHVSKEVEIKLSLEVSNVIERVVGPAQSVGYRVGTRNAVTNLRLRDGETQILAGLIRDDQRQSATGVPGLLELPILGRLFGPLTEEKDKTEIILLITPRIVRTVSAPMIARSALPAGTEGAVGVAPLRMNDSALVSVLNTGGTVQGRFGVTSPTRTEPSSGSSSSPNLPSNIALSIAGPRVVKANTEFDVVVLRSPGQVNFDATVDVTLSGAGASFSDGKTGSGALNLNAEQGSMRVKAGAAGSEIQLSVVGAKGPNGELILNGDIPPLQIKVEP
jgi:general secretion pathway protein D